MSIFELPPDGSKRYWESWKQPHVTIVDQPELRLERSRLAGHREEPRTERDPAPAGPYRLKVSIWRELVSKVGEVKRFADHHRGDVVALSADDAVRLFRAGAVEPATVSKATKDEPT